MSEWVSLCSQAEIQQSNHWLPPLWCFWFCVLNSSWSPASTERQCCPWRLQRCLSIFLVTFLLSTFTPLSMSTEEGWSAELMFMQQGEEKVRKAFYLSEGGGGQHKGVVGEEEVIFFFSFLGLKKKKFHLSGSLQYDFSPSSQLHLQKKMAQTDGEGHLRTERSEDGRKEPTPRRGSPYAPQSHCTPVEPSQRERRKKGNSPSYLGSHAFHPSVYSFGRSLPAAAARHSFRRRNADLDMSREAPILRALFKHIVPVVECHTGAAWFSQSPPRDNKLRTTFLDLQETEGLALCLQPPARFVSILMAVSPRGQI